MNSDDPLKKSVNSNDNNSSSWLRKDYDEINEHCAEFIPLANWLINKYCEFWWKNHPNTWQYQRAHHSICLNLVYPAPTREWTLRFIALELECNPVFLMNDNSEELKNIPVQLVTFL